MKFRYSNRVDKTIADITPITNSPTSNGGEV